MRLGRSFSAINSRFAASRPRLARPDREAAHENAGFFGRAFLEMVVLPVVVKGPAAGGEDLDAVTAPGEPGRYLKGMLLGASDERPPEPGNDEGDAAQGRRPITAKSCGP
jgi:hypothetical protein